MRTLRLIDGMSGNVVTVTGDAPFGDVVDSQAFDRRDDEIAADVVASLAASAYGSGEDRVVSSLAGGIVTLDGRVPQVHDAAAACRFPWLAPGAVDLVDHLAVGTSRPVTCRTDTAGAGS